MTFTEMVRESPGEVMSSQGVLYQGNGFSSRQNFEEG